MSVSVTLQGAYLNLADDDLSPVLWFRFATQISPQPQTPGEIRMYGTGRYVSLGAGVTERQIAVAATAVPAADVATLSDWDGQTVCYRDSNGEKLFGVFRSPQIDWHPYNDEADVSFTVAEVTYNDVES